MEIAEWIEEIEAEAVQCNSRPEAEQILKEVGFHCGGKSNGEMMCLAAQHGFIGVLKALETP
jgi:hypothetical protein